MRAGRPPLDPADVQRFRSELNLIPAKVNKLGGTKNAPVDSLESLLRSVILEDGLMDQTAHGPLGFAQHFNINPLLAIG